MNVKQLGKFSSEQDGQKWKYMYMQSIKGITFLLTRYSM